MLNGSLSYYSLYSWAFWSKKRNYVGERNSNDVSIIPEAPQSSLHELQANQEHFSALTKMPRSWYFCNFSLSCEVMFNVDNDFVPRVRHKVQGVGHRYVNVDVWDVSYVDIVVIWNKDLITLLGMIIQFYFLNYPPQHSVRILGQSRGFTILDRWTGMTWGWRKPAT